MTEWIKLDREFLGTRERSRFLRAGAVEGVVAHLRASGAAVVRVEAGEFRTSSEFFEQLATVLPFPDGFGNNWDALYDVLDEIESTWPFPVALIVVGMGELAAANVALLMQFTKYVEEFRSLLAEHGHQMLVVYDE